MNNGLPWFPFYYTDFFGSERVMVMDNEQIGCYLRLLSHQWIEGSVPADEERLLLVMCVTADGFKRVWPRVKLCFPPMRNKKRLRNKRLHDIRKEQFAKRKKLVEAGRKGGQVLKPQRVTSKPKGKHRLSNAQASLKPSLSIAQATEQSRIEQNREEGKEETPFDTELFDDESTTGITAWSDVVQGCHPLTARSLFNKWRGAVDDLIAIGRPMPEIIERIRSLPKDRNLCIWNDFSK